MLGTIMYLVSLFSLILFVFVWGAVAGIKIGADWDTRPLLDMRERLGVILVLSMGATIIFFTIGTAMNGFK